MHTFCLINAFSPSRFYNSTQYSFFSTLMYLCLDMNYYYEYYNKCILSLHYLLYVFANCYGMLYAYEGDIRDCRYLWEESTVCTRTLYSYIPQSAAHSVSVRITLWITGSSLNVEQPSTGVGILIMGVTNGNNWKFYFSLKKSGRGGGYMTSFPTLPPSFYERTNFWFLQTNKKVFYELIKSKTNCSRSLKSLYKIWKGNICL